MVSDSSTPRANTRTLRSHSQHSTAMASNMNTPRTNKNRPNSQTDTNLENMKSLLNTMKNEIIGSIKDEIQVLRNLVTSLSSGVEQPEKENQLLTARQQENKMDNSDNPVFDSKCSFMPEEIRQREIRKCNVIITGNNRFSC